jgi:class 3 adenylate cyclase
MKKRFNLSSKTIFSWLIILLPIGILIYAFANNANAPKKPKAIHGFLDLSNWNQQQNGNVSLDGEWKFYWNKLITPEDFKKDSSLDHSTLIQVPGIWNGLNKNVTRNGFATYSLDIKIKDTTKLYALKLITMSNAYKLWANDKLIATNGTVGTDKKSSVPEYRSQVVSFYSQSKNIRFVIQVSNFYHWKGGVWHPIMFGEYEPIQHERETRVILDMFLFGCLFIMAFYYLSIFSLRKSEKSTLFFGLMCAAVSLRSLFTGENLITNILPNLDWVIGRKIEFILTFVAVPIYISFARSLYPKATNKIIFWTINTIGLGLCLFILFSPVEIGTSSSYIFTFYSAFSSFYIIYIFIVATKRKEKEASLFLSTSIFFLLTILNEMLNQTEIIHTGLYLPVGLLIVIFAQSYILSARFSNAFRTTEIYARTLRKFVPTQFLNRIAKDGIESIKAGNAEKVEVTVLFSDIRSFTTISEQMTPDEVFKMLNKYLSYVEPPIRDAKGFVDKYMGDGIMALFEKDETHNCTYNAIIASLEMQSALNKYNEKRILESRFPIEMGIGLHTGQVIIGTIGGNERMDSTAIGDAVNLCSRIEGMTKMYGVNILISEDSLQWLENKSEFLLRFIDMVMPKGKTEPVGIWEIMGRISDSSMQTIASALPQYEEGMKFYKSGNVEEAKKKFESFLTISPEDKVSQIYISRCQEIIENGVNKNDDGITHLKNK